MSKLIPLCFPVWRFAHHADPYMASILYIRKRYAHDPEYEAALIQSVFDIAQANALARDAGRAAAFPEAEVVNA